MRNYWKTVGFFGLTLLIIIAYGFIWLSTMPPYNNETIVRATRAIESHGFKNVENLEQHFWGTYSAYGCNESDYYAFTGTALSSTGDRIEVVACTNAARQVFAVKTK